MRKLLSAALATSLLIGSMAIPPTYGANIWSDLKQAGEYEASGDLDLAAPLWERSLDYFDDLGTEDAWNNSALMAKKLGSYYDSVGDYEKAVLYYETEDKFWRLLGHDWGAADIARANEIRSYVRYYVQSDSAPIELAKFEPESGIYLGIYAENDKKIGQQIDLTDNVYGKDHAIYMYYQDFNQWMPSYTGSGQTAMDSINAKRVEAAGGALQVAMNAMSGLDVVTENQWLEKWAKEAASYDMPIFLRFCGEMNGDWVPWHGDPALYIEKYQLVHDVMAKYAPNVVMVWCPNDVPVELNGQKIEDYYPGDDYVDWVGVNFYVDYYDSGLTDLKSNHLQNPLTHLEFMYENYADKKPIMICETGVSHYSIPNSEDVTQWGAANLEKLYSMLPVVYPRVKAITYLSLNQANPNYMVGNRWSNYALSENNVVEEAYKNIISSDVFLSKVTETAVSPSQVYTIGDESALLGTQDIALDVKIPDFKVSKVNIFSDNGYNKSQTTLPFVIEKEALTGNIINIQILDSNGKVAINKLIKLDQLRNAKESIAKGTANE